MLNGEAPKCRIAPRIDPWRCEAVRHCRWVDEVVPDAPWILDERFMTKYNIDYVAHDEDPYAAAGHDDVYAFVKNQGIFSGPFLKKKFLKESILLKYQK